MSWTAEHMVEHAALTTLVAPVIVLAWPVVRRSWRFSIPAPGLVARSLAAAASVLDRPALAWAAFVVAQWGLHLAPPLEPDRLDPVLDAAAHLAFLGAGVWFWSPLLGRRRLRDPERSLYLFCAIPAIDLVGVALMVAGNVAAGIAMLAGSLPIGAVAVAITWSWLVGEHHRAIVSERGHGAPG